MIYILILYYQKTIKLRYQLSLLLHTSLLNKTLFFKSLTQFPWLSESEEILFCTRQKFLASFWLVEIFNDVQNKIYRSQSIDGILDKL